MVAMIKSKFLSLPLPTLRKCCWCDEDERKKLNSRQTNLIWNKPHVSLMRVLEWGSTASWRCKYFLWDENFVKRAIKILVSPHNSPVKHQIDHDDWNELRKVESQDFSDRDLRGHWMATLQIVNKNRVWLRLRS